MEKMERINWPDKVTNQDVQRKILNENKQILNAVYGNGNVDGWVMF